MRIALYGGFAEKGRTCLGIESDGYRLLVDAGVKTSARGRGDYYPAIAPSELSAYNALVVTHAHEDHVAALGFLIAQGFRGRMLMTPETLADAEQSIADYGEPAHLESFRRAHVEPLALGADGAELGPFKLSTGRSGHIAGGVWCRLEDARSTLAYCGDVAPSSPVFAFDPVSRCDTLIIDGSYGDDATSFADRAHEIRRWIHSKPRGCVLPTPLHGRSAELLAILNACALAPGMRDALRKQIDESTWLTFHGRSLLQSALTRAEDWSLDEALPAAPLLCHDGMGVCGPSRDILQRARQARHPTLFTGHLPHDSPGERMVAEHLAEWIRLPTHPTLPENVAIIDKARPKTVIGHSCDADVLQRLASHIPNLRIARTGERIEAD